MTTNERPGFENSGTPDEQTNNHNQTITSSAQSQELITDDRYSTMEVRESDFGISLTFSLRKCIKTTYDNEDELFSADESVEDTELHILPQIEQQNSATEHPHNLSLQRGFGSLSSTRSDAGLVQTISGGATQL